MQFVLDHEIEELVATEVREGRFESPEALLSAAVRHFLIAQKYGEDEANKLAVLREELRRADAEIDAGHYTEIEVTDLPAFFESIEQRAMIPVREKKSGY